MDSLTHLVAGALTPLAFRDTPKRAAVVAFGIVAGELPDMDVFFGSGPEALLVLHRGITHALFWQPVLVLLAVIPFFLWLNTRRAKPLLVEAFPSHAGWTAQHLPGPGGMGAFTFSRMYLVALVGVYTHIYLDCMTTFGTQILLPFSDMRVGFPAVFIVDLLLTVPALTLLVLALRRKAELRPAARRSRACPQTGIAFVSASSRKLARAGLAWVLVYPLLCLGVNATAAHLLGPSMVGPDTPGGPGAKLQLMTEPFSPFVWKAIVDTGDSYQMSTVSLLSLLRQGNRREHRPVTHIYHKPDKGLYASLQRQHRIFGWFASFSSLVTQSQRPADGRLRAGPAGPVTEYAFIDLRYAMSPESPARWVGRDDANFILEAAVNASGGLAAWRFLERGKDAGRTPWEFEKR